MRQKGTLASFPACILATGSLSCWDLWHGGRCVVKLVDRNLSPSQEECPHTGRLHSLSKHLLSESASSTLCYLTSSAATQLGLLQPRLLCLSGSYRPIIRVHLALLPVASLWLLPDDPFPSYGCLAFEILMVGQFLLVWMLSLSWEDKGHRAHGLSLVIPQPLVLHIRYQLPELGTTWSQKSNSPMALKQVCLCVNVWNALCKSYMCSMQVWICV